MSNQELEERIQRIEDQIKAVKVAWVVLKWIGYLGLSLAGLWAAFHGASK